MRTTLTIENDVTVLLEQFQKEHHTKFKEAVNKALRTGLLALTQKKNQKNKTFETRSINLGAPLISSLDNIQDALAISENESFR